MALVPYDENSIHALSKLHSSSANFTFANHSLRLSQDWNQFGVAAVVWDAVSSMGAASLLYCFFLIIKSLNVNDAFVVSLFCRQSSCAYIWSWDR